MTTRDFDPDLKAHYQQPNQSTTHLLRLESVDGTQVLGFTDFEEDLLFDDQQGGGAITYQAAVGVGASAIEHQAGFKPDNLEVRWILRDGVLDGQDLLDGVWARAWWRLMEIDWNDLTQGPHIKSEGYVGEPLWDYDGRATVALHEISELFLRTVNTAAGTDCQAEFGHAIECGFETRPALRQDSESVEAVDPFDAKLGDRRRPLLFQDRILACSKAGDLGIGEPAIPSLIGSIVPDGTAEWAVERAPTLEVTIASIVDPYSYTVNYTGDAPNEWLANGRVEWQPGAANAGKQSEILSWDLATKTVILTTRFRNTVLVDDPIFLIYGCNRDRDDCEIRRNVTNMRHAYPDIPGDDARFQIEDA